MTAHKSNLIKSITNNIPNVPKEDIKTAVELIINYLSEELAKQNRIEIRGFGSFSLRSRITHKMYIEKNTEKQATYKAVYFRGTKNSQVLIKN